MAWWEKMPGAAKDVAVDRFGTAWVIGNNPAVGGFGVHRWNATTNDWDQASGGGVKIACGRNSVIIVNDANEIYRGVGFPPVWTKLPGSAKDVGAGDNPEFEIEELW